METIIRDIISPDPTPKIQLTIEHPPYISTRHKNLEIAKVYTNIVREMRMLLANMNSVENRTYLLTSNVPTDKYTGEVLYEFICIMCSLTLNVKHYNYYIELDTDIDIAKVIGGWNFRMMLRAAFRHTSYEFTEHFLEDCIFIETNMNDHYNYFRNRLLSADEENGMIVVEDAYLE